MADADCGLLVLYKLVHSVKRGKTKIDSACAINIPAPHYTSKQGILLITTANMASRAALQSWQGPLRSSARSASKHSLPLKHHQANCRQQSRAFHRGAHSRASSYHAAYATSTAPAAAFAAGILAVSALALWLDHHGLQIQFLQSAKADENITSPTFLDETPVHRVFFLSEHSLATYVHTDTFN
jgi:hypothetical protein